MHLKYLSLCLFSLCLTACAQHGVRSQVASASLEQKAIQSVNAMYEYPSYDYRGNFKITVDPSQIKQNVKAENTAKLDAELQKKVDQYLREQKVALSKAQKQTLYAAIANEQGDLGLTSSTRSEKINTVLFNLLNDLQFSYDGSIHYRQKMGSFNLTARYEKPTLLVQAKLPMVLDLENYKFYINYFGLMPYLVNKDNQNNLAYVDFSKYKAFFKNVDKKKFIEYLKASSAVSYRLAEPQNLQRVSLTEADRKAGAVERIRLKTTVEQLLLEVDLFGQVNKKYLQKSVLGLDEEKLAETLAAEIAASDAKKGTADKEEQKVSSDDAAAVSQQLYSLVNAHLGNTSTSEDEEVESASSEEASDVAVAETEQTSENEEVVALTEDQCIELKSLKKPVALGDINYCQIYGIDVLDQSDTSIQKAQIKSRQDALKQIFEAYNQNQFINDEAFKALWLKHKDEIEQALPKQRNPITIDVALDDKGRAVNMDYDVDYTPAEFKHRFNIKADMQILNYGKATSIDQQQLKQAKSVAEASKGSMLENFIKGFSEKLGQSDVSEHPVGTHSDVQDLDANLAVLADKTYDATHAYDKTYKAVFIAKLTAEKPSYIKYYSVQQLQEIAEVYAYWFSDEDTYNPQGKALERITALQKKHHLEQDDQFDHELGRAVDHIVLTTIQGKTGREAWQKLQKQYKQPAQLFSKQYQLEFEKQNGVSAEEKHLLSETADILGNVYVAARKKQLSEKTIQNLKPEHNEFIDYEVFREVYKQMVAAKK
ncbi:signal peptide [Acinetobacter baumannii]|nr:signal peptide [Acinetobacter baumannii]